MAFRFITVFVAIGLVTAADYEYNRPSSQAQITANKDISNTINTFNTQNSISDSQSTLNGYNYPPLSNVDGVLTTSNLHVEQQQHNQQHQQQQPHTAPVAYWPPAKYEYSYGVHDIYTGDIKSHSETRDGYFVHGTYSVVDPDGFERIVTYTADDVNGFNAIVNRKPYTGTILKSTEAVDLQQQDKDVTLATATTTSAHIKESSHVESAVKTSDSYANPPTQHNKDGPYP